jgi:hypothetical protein
MVCSDKVRLIAEHYQLTVEVARALHAMNVARSTATVSEYRRLKVILDEIETKCEAARSTIKEHAQYHYC